MTRSPVLNSQSLMLHPRQRCLPADVRRCGRVLLNQQLWLWGQDIRRPEGNALIEHGFTRLKPPDGVRGSNTYVLQLPCGARVFLWAFGFCYQRPGCGGIFMPRFSFTPRLARCDDLPAAVWSATQLGAYRPPRDSRQWARAWSHFIPALRWVADYERWIGGARSSEYRRVCIDSWRQTQVHAACLGAEWEALAERCDMAMRSFIAARQ